MKGLRLRFHLAITFFISLVRIDLIYEGIATKHERYHERERDHKVRIDLIYEGIATFNT